MTTTPSTARPLAALPLAVLVDCVMNRALTVAQANHRGSPSEMMMWSLTDSEDELPEDTTYQAVLMEISRRCPAGWETSRPLNRADAVTEDAFLQTIDAMESMGGGFVQALAVAWRKADGENRALLMDGFRHYFNEYRQKAVGRSVARAGGFKSTPPGSEAPGQVCPCGATLGGSNHNRANPKCHLNKPGAPTRSVIDAIGARQSVTAGYGWATWEDVAAELVQRGFTQEDADFGITEAVNSGKVTFSKFTKQRFVRVKMNDAVDARMGDKI